MARRALFAAIQGKDRRALKGEVLATVEGLMIRFNGWQLDQSDFRNRVDDVRKDAKGQGFEAIAWFQPYHVWTEETWGIYFDARKLDDLARWADLYLQAAQGRQVPFQCQVQADP